MDKKKILICGGHLSPALALIEGLMENNKFELIYAGRKHSLEGDCALSLEYKTISSLGLKFIELNPGRLSRIFTRKAIRSLCKIPLGLVRSFIIISREKPDIVISFGGHVAFSLSIAAYLNRVIVVTHEQTRVMGLTNRIISKFAGFTCLSWPNTRYADNNKFIITGNLIRKIDDKNDGLLHFGDRNLPLVYITGGSQGSKSINGIIRDSLLPLLTNYRIIHQCGMAENSADYHALQRVKSTLPINIKNNYSVWEILTPSQAIAAIKSSDFIIGRSGANTVTEIALLGKPAIFIPLPWSAENEQGENAKWLVENGSAIILTQKELTADKFVQAVDNFHSNIRSFLKYALELKKTIPVDGVYKLKKIIISSVK